MAKRITKKEAKSALDTQIKVLRERFNQGDYEYLLETKNNVSVGSDSDDIHNYIHHLGGHIMRLNAHIGLGHMTREEINQYHATHGSGFFGDLWNGIKKVGKTVFTIARPMIKPVGDLIGAKYGVPAGTIADTGLKTFGLGAPQGAGYRSGGRTTGGRYRTGGEVAKPVKTAQRRMRPEDYS